MKFTSRRVEPTPARLEKQTSQTLLEKIELWMNTHMSICIALAIVSFLLIFCLLCFAVCGVSSLESGTYYNHLGGV